MNQQAKKETPQYLSSTSILKGRWQIVEKIGNGGFGEIYKAKDMDTKRMVAVKVESCTSNKQVLKIEALILKRLQGLQHTCDIQGCGRTDKVNFIVMTLLGQNLSDLRKKQDKQVFSLSTVLRLAVQVVTAVQEMHDCGFLHRDIKPSNFAMGTGNDTRKCFLIDFGLARQYTTLTGELKQPRPIAGFRGTVRYASINAHLGNELGRHDDLWSVFYMLIELATGSLPWRRIREKEEAGKAKQECDHNVLVKGLPLEFKLFMDHLRKLTYHDKPDYQYLINLFQNAQQRYGVSSSDPYDWETGSMLPSTTSASGLSPPVVSPECPTTPEAIESQKKLDSAVEKSLGEKVKKICQVFKTMNSPKATRVATAVTGNSPQSSDKTKQHTLKSHIDNSSLNQNNKASAHSPNDDSMQVDRVKNINNECPLMECEKEVSKSHLGAGVVVPDTIEKPKSGFYRSLGSNSEQTHSSVRSAVVQLNTGFVVEDASKDVSMSSGSEAGPHVKKFERVDSPLLQTVELRNDILGCSSVSLPAEKTDLFTSSLVIIPRPPLLPPRTGYFCTSARKRKFVKIGKRILANSLRQDCV